MLFPGTLPDNLHNRIRSADMESSRNAHGRGKDAWGEFISPDRELEQVDDLVAHLKLPIFSGHKAVAGWAQYRGIQPLFDAVMQRNESFSQAYEDQCSARYYFDLFVVLEALRGKFNRVAEVGVFLGGASAVISGCCDDMDFDLDLIDINPVYLRFTYERLRRTHPGVENRVRMFYGGLPEYTAKVLVGSADQVIVHHDGSHAFDQVVKDMSSLYFARDTVTAVVAQDTHLRGRIHHLNFVDMALYGVFGTDLAFTPIGARYSAEDTVMTRPNEFQGNYFMPEQPEGMVLLMEQNEFRYPHPSMALSEFLGKPL
jgi:hypothetical protein